MTSTYLNNKTVNDIFPWNEPMSEFIFREHWGQVEPLHILEQKKLTILFKSRQLSERNKNLNKNIDIEQNIKLC